MNSRLGIQAVKTMELLDEFYEHLKKVGKFPHKGQQELITNLQRGEVKKAMFVCSRNFGKSVTAMIDQALYSALHKRTTNYIISPYVSQTKEIYWASGLMSDVIPPTWLLDGDAAFNKSELRAFFKNGSFIKLDGADNDTAVRGYKPDRLTADEFQGWRKETWDAMQPNLLGKNATVVLIGTPPDIENHFTDQWSIVEQGFKKGVRKFYFAHRTIWDNPLIPHESKVEMRNEYLARGELSLWEQEFEAKFVKGGARRLLPQFKLDRNVAPINVLIAEIKEKPEQVEYYTVIDPSGTRFGVGFFAYNKHISKAYLLDEIVETDERFLTAEQILERIKEKENIYYDPRQPKTAIYDEAAKLFALELANLHYFAIPTQKKQNEKSNNISLLRDCLSKDKFVMSDKCEQFQKDFLNYRRNDNGDIIKEKDEGVDVSLYFLAESGYSFNSVSSKTVDKSRNRSDIIEDYDRDELIKGAEGLASIGSSQMDDLEAILFGDDDGL